MNGCITNRQDILIEKILIVGFGSIGKRHLMLAREQFPFADIRILRHQMYNQMPPNANGCFFELEDALNFAPQLAVISNPAPFHLPFARALAKVGSHLLIEKPLSDTWRGAVSLIQPVHGNQIFLLGYNLRYLPSLKFLKKHILEGSVGRVLSVRCEVGQNLPSWRPYEDYRKSASARRELGGGVLLELSHELDYLCWLFGEVQWVRATLGNQSDLEIDVEDTVHMTLAFARQNTVPILATVNMDLIRYDRTRQCTVIGDKGSLRWNAINNSVEIYSAGASSWKTLFVNIPESNQSYLAEWQHLVACIDGFEDPLVTIEDGLYVLKIVDAARLSSCALGAQISLNDLRE